MKTRTGSKPWIGMALLAALTLVAACGAAERPTARGGVGAKRSLATVGPGPLFLSGGGDDPPRLIRRFRDLAGGAGARIVIVPFAGGPPAGAAYREAFEREGVTDLAVLSVENGSEAANRKLLAGAGGIYIPGGLTAVLVERVAPLADAIREAWRAGAAVGGHSAGAMVCADRVITRGEATAALVHGLDEASGGLTIRPGMGLLPGAIVDTHFGERARFPRLWVAAGADARLGIGVDPDTAAIWQPDGSLTAFGSGAVTLIRPDTATRGPARVSVLAPGERVDLRDWRTVE